MDEKRLIDANALKNHINVLSPHWLAEWSTIGVLAEVDKAPTVDAVEVVHGRWERVIPTKSAAKWSTKVSCSACHKQGYTHHKFCPNCGAKMDGERKDNA